jgi:hypothetical protein
MHLATMAELYCRSSHCRLLLHRIITQCLLFYPYYILCTHRLVASPIEDRLAIKVYSFVRKVLCMLNLP